jgi:hypothetical protein
MAKQAKAETVEVATQEVVTKVTAPKEPTKPSWEIKNRTYYLKGTKTPLTYTIPGKHTRKHALLYFDEESGKQREIRFDKGMLEVDKSQQNLQKLLSLYHPLKDKAYQEYSAVEEAVDQLDVLTHQVTALNAAISMEVDHAEAILRVELGSKVNEMSSKELRRDLLLFARNNPSLFLSLANDENVQLRNVGIRASELGIIKLSSDQRSFTWGSNGRKLMNVPFDENPYSAFAAWLKTDEGVEVYRSIDKKL